jgi:hypothetical protein
MYMYIYVYIYMCIGGHSVLLPRRAGVYGIRQKVRRAQLSMLYVHIHTYIHTYIHKHTFTYICTYTYILIHMYVATRTLFTRGALRAAAGATLCI